VRQSHRRGKNAANQSDPQWRCLLADSPVEHEQRDDGQADGVDPLASVAAGQPVDDLHLRSLSRCQSI